MPIELDIDVLTRGLHSSNNTASNGMYFMTGYQPDSPAKSNSIMMYISNEKRVGIGTQNPREGTFLHVAGPILCTSLIQDPTAEDPGGDQPGAGGGGGDETPGSGFDIVVVDSKIFVQGREAPPETDGIPISLQEGDMWWDTDDDPPTLYISEGPNATEIGVAGSGEWVKSEHTVITLIPDGVLIFNQSTIPESQNIGDVWLDSGRNWLAYKAESVGATEIAPGEWVLDSEVNAELQPRLKKITTSLTGIMSDSEVITYFNEEASGDGFMRFLGTHSNASFGDVWIDISELNRYAAEGLTTNAINRWGNSKGGFIDSNRIDPDTGFTEGLAWRAAPTDAIGVIYLNTYLNKNVSDRKTTTYFSNSFTLIDGPPDGGGVYGPNSVATPTGIRNFNPQYDTWYDITPDDDGIAENQVFVYLVNGTFDYANSSNTGVGSWGRRMFKTGVFDSETSETGWWNARDASILRANSLFATLNAAFGSVESQFTGLTDEFGDLRDDLTAGLFTIPFADREVKAFFSRFDKNWNTNGNDRPKPGGNNDIWILTDYLLNSNGTANFNSIYVSTANQTHHEPPGHDADPPEYDAGGTNPEHHWLRSNNNALGLVYLELYSSGSLGLFSRGSNYMPRGISLWDAPADDYNIYAHAPGSSLGTPTLPSSSLLARPYQIGWRHGTGDTFGNFLHDVVIDNTGGANSWVGESSLKATLEDGSGTRQHLTITGTTLPWKSTDGTSDPTYMIDIPKGKRWIFSYYVRSNVASAASGIHVFGANTTHNAAGQIIGGASWGNALEGIGMPSAYTWYRNSEVIDLTTTTLTPASGGLEATSSGSPLNEITKLNIAVVPIPQATPSEYWFDGFQLEEVGNNIFTPSQFTEPSDHSDILGGRKITDGKIITHHSPEWFVTGSDIPYTGAPDPFYYGPKSNVTPNELPNPEPHGDLWFNSSNNNMVFRYHQNATDYSAQSAWYIFDPTLDQSSNSGWYPVEDNRFGLFFANIIHMNTQINDALANLASTQSKVDHDVISFFAPEDGVLFGNAISNPSANFGDIWINTIDENANLSHGGLTPNAIFRYQNGTSFHADYPFGRTSPPVGSGGVDPLAWYHAPNDSLGVIYLETAQNRNVADQKTVTYFLPGAADADVDAGGYFGPNVAITPSGILNSNPKNDLWVDTGNGNVLFIYKGNQDFGATYTKDINSRGYWDKALRYGVWAVNPETSPSGWYSVQDSWISIIRHNLIANAASVTDALANSVDARAIADHEIISYYEYEEGDFIAQSAPTTPGSGPDGVGYGDIWINQSYWNTLPDGSLSTNAIVRWQNSTGGSVNSTGGSALTWYQSPNNAVGKVFLDAYLARNIADRKTVVFYGPNNGIGFGPNPNTTPSGLNNPNPEGDLWIDTSDDGSGTGGVNRLYVYKTNSSFRIGEYNEFYTNANVWAQTVHTGFFNRTANFNLGGKTGWWNAQDSEFSILRANIGNILTDVITIGEQVDREILAHFLPHDIANVPNASGNGDVWIHSDGLVVGAGTPNTAAIWVANSSGAVPGEHGGGSPDPDTFYTSDDTNHFWVNSPNNAVGLFYLEAYSAGITGQFARGTNIMPRAISLFDAPITDYDINISGTARANVRPYSITANNTGGHLPDFDVSIVESAPTGFANTYFGNKALKISHSWNGADGAGKADVYPEIIFANTVGANSETGNASPSLASFKEYGIDIVPGKKWILSLWAQNKQPETNGFATNDPCYLGAYTLDIDNAASFGEDGNFWQSATPDPGPPPLNIAINFVNGWSRIEHIIDLREAPYNTHNKLIPSFRSELPNEVSSFTGTSDVLIDAIQLEEVADNINEASPFRDPSDTTAVIFGREITDGKVVAHYSPEFPLPPGGGFGPTPHITPSGLPNPEPHGDFWINTSNNNQFFVYNQVGADNTAQTANYSFYTIDEMTESGWYSAQDRQIGYTYANVVEHAANIEHLFANVEFERGLTDHDVVGFFENEGGDFQNAIGTHDYAAFGDIWINTSVDNHLANGALHSNAIFRWQNTTAVGANSHAARGILVWEHAANNLTGQVFLSTWLSRNISDRKTVIYFEGNTSLAPGGPYHGPNVAFLPGSEVPNPNPDGDLWMDTGGSNRLYIYKTNSSFQIGNYIGVYTDEGVWAQTTHNAASAGGPFDRNASDATGRTGWWDAQGFDSSQIDQDIMDNRANAAFALANAQFAQALAANAQVIADGEIVSFYNIEDVGAGFANDTTHGEASYGDIWINISSDNQLANGALHPNAIFRYQNTSGGSSRPSATDPTDVKWYHAPNNAIGKVYLDAWKSQNTADAKVVTYIAPGTPLGTVPALYGPDPSSTPGGVHNPNPENDLWLDSNDNNRIYRYQVIGGNVTSIHAYQTPNNTHSGWADVRDARLGDFPFAEHRKAYVPMNEWSVANVGYGEELVMWDESDNLNHARQGHLSSEFSGDHNDFVDTTIKGIPTKALNRTNSITADTNPSGNYDKDIALLHHDDIRNANQQSYSIWFKPTGGYQRHGHRIISRDASDFWAITIGGNATSYTGETNSYDEFYPADGSYVNAAIIGSASVWPVVEGENIFLAAQGAPGGVLKYNTWNHIAFTLDYKGDDEYGNSVWYFTNEDDGWENANVFHFNLDKDASANHNYAGGWSADDEGRGVGLNNVERANAAGFTGGYAPVAHYSEFRYYDTFLSQASIKKLFDNPTGIEESSQGLLRTIRSQAVADGEIISFYADSGGDFVRGASHPTANFGDIWIDTSPSNANLTHGGFTVDAINRYQNTSFGPSPSEGTLVWEAAPTNSVGKVYLDAALARNVADQKTVTYFVSNTETSDGFGPNVAVTPTGTFNPNPDSDLWIDTNTNRLYIYKTNNTFSTTYLRQDSDPTNQTAWAQTIYSGNFTNDGLSPTGWWDVQDTILRDLIYVNEWEAANALASAANAQSAADHEILAFFEPEAAVGPAATGNGDVWIFTGYPVDLNGSPNTESIYIANTLGTGIPDHVSAPDHWWNPAPNNAIGRMYLENYSAGTRGQFDSGFNWMPRGLSLFDAPREDYYDYAIHGAGHISPGGVDVVAPYTAWNTNIPVDYNTLPYPIKTDGELIIDDTDAYHGEKSLKFTWTGGSFGKYFSLGANTSWQNWRHTILGGDNQGGVAIPTGKRWILSWRAKASDADITHTPKVAFDNGVVTDGVRRPNIRWTNYKGISTSEWEQFSIVLDLRGSHNFTNYTTSAASRPNEEMTSDFGVDHNVNTSKGLAVSFWFAGSGFLSGRSVSIDAIQLEQVVGDRVTPSEFQEPSDGSAIVFGRQITDGKIVTHYSEQFGGGGVPMGPKPHVTPTGLPNPEPHGDFWINTTNNHMIFRYHQNDINFTAQTANYAYYDTLTGDHDSGWYTGQDQQVIWNLANVNQHYSDLQDALAQTSFAQSRIDNDITAYFYPDSATPRPITGGSIIFSSGQTEVASPPIEFGDIWIDTGSTHMHSNGTLGAGAIHRAQNTADTSTMTWVPKPNNPIGQVYLNTWATKNASDRKTITYFSNSFVGLGIHYGPNTWHALNSDGSAGSYNPNPEGDFWLNTTREAPENYPNNQLYIYKTNSTFIETGRAQTIHSGVFTIGQSETGWWDATDTRVNTAVIEARASHESIFLPGGLNEQAQWLFGNIAFNFTQDNDRVILFQPYGSTDAGYNHRTSVAASEGLGFDFHLSDSKAVYGDIWINVSGANQLEDASLHVNAIHRAMNSTGGHSPSGGLGWYRSPDNQLGTLYLENYLTRNVSDRKSAIFLSPGWVTGGGAPEFDGRGELVLNPGEYYHGPNVTHTDPDTQNIFNPNPEGDLWFDTTELADGTPRNVLYVYKTNSSFHIGEPIDTPDDSVWAQTTYSGVFTFGDSPTGWYDVKDSRISTAGIAADREILAFFKSTTETATYATDQGFPTDNGAFGATGNGDIWIVTDWTDGGANTGAIFRYNTGVIENTPGVYGRAGGADATHKWMPSPDNAIGLAYLKGYAASHSSSGNKMPRGYSKFDTGSTDYPHMDASPWDTTILPYPISSAIRPEGASVAHTISITANDTTPFGTHSLRVIPGIDPQALNWRSGVAFANNYGSGSGAYESVSKYGISIPPGKRWIISAYARANTIDPANTSMNMSILTNNTSSQFSGVIQFFDPISAGTRKPQTKDVWEQFSWVLDLTTADDILYDNHPDHPSGSPKNEVNKLVLLPSFKSISVPLDVEYDITAIQLEQVSEGDVAPTEFQEPSSASDTSFGRVIADGKVVAFFDDGKDHGLGYAGPPPNTSPTGVPNPDPNGDMWIDTANGNVLYQYYANSAYGGIRRGEAGIGDIADTTESQRILYVHPPAAGDRTNASVGWISTQDTGIAAANLRAYNAQVTADYANTNFNKVFTDPVPGGPIPISIKKGDIWFNTGDGNKQYTAQMVGGGANEIKAGEWELAQDESIPAMLFGLAGSDPFGLNPFFGTWDNQFGPPNGWLEGPGTSSGTGAGTYSQNSVFQRGSVNNDVSVSFTGGAAEGNYLYRTIEFPTPLYPNSFISGVYVGHVGTPTVTNEGVPGLTISLHHRAEGDISDPGVIEHHQASLGNNYSGSVSTGNEVYPIGSPQWEIVPFRAVSDSVGGSRVITAVTFSIGIFSNSSVHVGGSNVNMAAGTGTTANFDQIYFDVNHPFLRLDRAGGVLGSYIDFAQIKTAHIDDAQITNAKIEDATITYAKIDTVNAESIQTGTIGVGVTVGGDAKVFIDGATGRIIIRD
jgi:hypothetical protein